MKVADLLNQVGVEIERRLEVVNRRGGKPGAKLKAAQGRGARRLRRRWTKATFTRLDCRVGLYLALVSTVVLDSAGSRGQTRQIPAPTGEKTRRAWGR